MARSMINISLLLMDRLERRAMNRFGPLSSVPMGKSFLCGL
jgi:hypothetical protein